MAALIPPTMIGVIADDLTGAAELGAVALRHGLKSEVHLGCEPPLSSPQIDLISLDTDSRSLPPSEAAVLAARGAALLSALAPAWIYKKVDSVLRGNVVAEIESIMKELNRQMTLLVPANPAFGRTIADGTYYLKGKPISETDFARDPEHPRLCSDVLSLLGSERNNAVGVLKVGEPLPVSGIAVGETPSSAEVAHWASCAGPEILCAGGAQFFGDLLRARGHRLLLQPPIDPEPPGRELFVCGSFSEATRVFVNDSESHGTRVFRPSLQAGQGNPETLARDAFVALARHRRVILCIGLPFIDDRMAARRLASDLVKSAALILRSGDISHLYVEGGATAAALVREMGWRRFRVLRELAPGVTTLSPDESKMQFTIKPGSYPGWPV